MHKHQNYHLLPDFPRIPHLLPPTYRGIDDIVLQEEAVAHVLENKLIVEEKLDGANCGMTYVDKVGVIRNRKHILSKNYFRGKHTPAKDQFLSAWGWQSANREKFELLYKLAKERMGVYGEWCLAIHGVIYNNLPSAFIAYALYSPERYQFIPAGEARDLLSLSGFNLSPLLFKGKANLEQLKTMAEGRSRFSTRPCEGIVIKVIDSDKQYKLIRANYQQNAAWDDKIMRKQPSFDKDYLDE